MNTRLIRKHQPLALAVALALGVGSAHAASITVTDGHDNGTTSTCTLRQAIVSSNDDDATGSSCMAGNGTDVINFDASLSGATITLGGSELGIGYSTVTINGSGQTIDGNNASGVVSVYMATATLSNLTLTGGNAPYNGGGITIYGSDVTLSDSTVSGNIAGHSGGGIASTGGGGQGYLVGEGTTGMPVSLSSLTLINSTVSGNSAGANGGGIASYGSDITLTKSTVSRNTASRAGGGIASQGEGGKGYLAGARPSSLSGTKTTTGGPPQSIGSLTLANSTVSGNSGSTYAGGIFAGGTQIDISDSTIADNQLDASTKWGAGGIYLTSGSSGTLRGSTISGNNADGGSDYGTLTGGVYTWDSSVSMINCTVSGNSASGPDLMAGGVSNSYSSSDVGNGYGLTLINTTISGNSASATSGSSSGGLLLGGYSFGGATLQNTILSGNTGGSDKDFFANYGAATASHSLLGSSQSGSFGGNGNVFNDNPGLSGLANNGGLTLTMALQVGSPAIDVGDNALIPGGVQYDQRGSGFPRILNGIVDLGSIEYGTSGTAPPTASTSIAVPSSSMWSKGLLGLLAGLFGVLTLTRRQRRGQTL